MKFKTHEIKKLGIKPKKKLNEKQKKYICDFVSNKIDLNYGYIFDGKNNWNSSLLKTPMYLAEIPKELSKANYIYQYKEIYIKENYDFSKIDEFLFHECVHAIQDKRYKNGKLKQIGICEFTNIKINGLMFNEAAIQYIVSNIYNKKLQLVNFDEIKIKTLSTNYYPIITSLINQIILLIGDKKLIESTINGNNEFNYEVIDNFGESTFYFIRDSFDEITNLNNNYEEINYLYRNISRKIYEEYFNRLNKRIDLLEDIKIIEEKLNLFREFAVETCIESEFLEFYKIEQENLRKIEVKLKNKYALVLTSNNVFYKVWRNIRQAINKKEIKNG